MESMGANKRPKPGFMEEMTLGLRPKECYPSKEELGQVIPGQGNGRCASPVACWWW